MRREIKRKVQMEINVERETERKEQKRKWISIKKVIYFQNVTYSCQSCKVNSVFVNTGWIFSCPEVANWLLNMRTRQNIELHLKIKINLSLPVTTLNIPMANRSINILSCFSSWDEEKVSIFFSIPALRNGQERKGPSRGSREQAEKKAKPVR